MKALIFLKLNYQTFRRKCNFICVRCLDEKDFSQLRGNEWNKGTKTIDVRTSKLTRDNLNNIFNRVNSLNIYRVCVTYLKKETKMWFMPLNGWKSNFYIKMGIHERTIWNIIAYKWCDIDSRT